MPVLVDIIFLLIVRNKLSFFFLLCDIEYLLVYVVCYELFWEFKIIEAVLISTAQAYVIVLELASPYKEKNNSPFLSVLIDIFKGCA